MMLLFFCAELERILQCFETLNRERREKRRKKSRESENCVLQHCDPKYQGENTFYLEGVVANTTQFVRFIIYLV